MFHFKKYLKGQSLLELLVSITLGVIFIGSSVGAITLALWEFNSLRQHLQANSLMRQAAEVIQMFAYDNWHRIYDLPKDVDHRIVFQVSDNTWSISSGQEISTFNNVPYKRYFRVSNVNRDENGNISESGNDDPSTQKITIFLEYGNNYLSSSTLSFYLTRFYGNQVFHQTDWSGGGGRPGPVTNPKNRFDNSTNINYSTSGQITMATPSTTPAQLISSILDTNVAGGVGFNSLLWQGNLGTGGVVQFQVAFSNSPEGPWDYYGPTSMADWYQPNSGVSVTFPTTGSSSPQNCRYIRYKVQLITSTTSPEVDDIIINWSL